MNTHFFILFILLVVVVIVLFLIFALVIVIVFVGRWSVVAVAAIGSMLCTWMSLNLSILLSLHSTLGELLHHLDELLPIVLEQIVSNCKYAT
jgi:hypothetical protein